MTCPPKTGPDFGGQVTSHCPRLLGPAIRAIIPVQRSSRRGAKPGIDAQGGLARLTREICVLADC